MFFGWTVKRLLNTLFAVLKQTATPVAICMFIDGLDEFEGDHYAFVQLIKRLADQVHLKICLSSRPWQVFDESFCGLPSLRLQDLTRNSIRSYARFQLSDLIQQCTVRDSAEEQRAMKLLNDIVSRADGVFLWVVIAVRDLRDGLRGFADIDALADAIDQLPSELEDLFLHMLKRIKPAFQRDAAQYLQIMLYCEAEVGEIYKRGLRTLYLCGLHLSFQQRNLGNTPFSYEKVSSIELSKACDKLRTRLLSHIPGFVDLTLPPEGNGLYRGGSEDDPMWYIQVTFVHRTARDFLSNNFEAKKFLEHQGLTIENVHLCIARGILAQLVQLAPLPDGDKSVFPNLYGEIPLELLKRSLRDIALAEKSTGRAQSALMRSLDFESLNRNSPDYSKKPTWDNEPYVFQERQASGEILWSMIDIVGMAASVDMEIFVCEQLHLQADQCNDNIGYPDAEIYCNTKASVLELSWNNQIQNFRSAVNPTSASRQLGYRAAVSGCLQWGETSHIASTLDNSQTTNMVETYLLSCCSIKSFNLAHALLEAGANPMARFKSLSEKAGRSFWERWIHWLGHLRRISLHSFGVPEGLRLSQWQLDCGFSLDRLVNQTKTLLKHGADINKRTIESYFDLLLFVDEPSATRFEVGSRRTALYTLENCFGTDTEFRAFIAAIGPVVQRPTRWVKMVRNLKGLGKHVDARPVVEVTKDESNMLVHLLEAAEHTLKSKEANMFQAKAEEVFWNNYPGNEFEESQDSEEYQDSEEDLNSEDYPDSEED